jgi:hypothetical protein
MKPEIEFAKKVNDIIIEHDIPRQQAVRCLTKICMAICSQSAHLDPESMHLMHQAMDEGFQAGRVLIHDSLPS